MDLRLRIVWTIFAKELLDTLRDRRTLVRVLLLPVVLYPLLVLGLGKVQGEHKRAQEADVSRVAVWGELPDDVATLLNAKNKFAVETSAARKETAEALAPAARRVLEAHEVDAVLVVSPEAVAAYKEGGVLDVTAFTDSTEDRSHFAGQRLESAFARVRTSLQVEREKQRGLPEGFSLAVRIELSDVAAGETKSGQLLGRVLPLLLITMCLLGVFLPAIDLTAGEKERGTLQTLLCAPVTPFEVLLGKYFTVWTISLVMGAANLLSFALTVRRMLPAELPIPLWMYPATFGFLIPLTGLFSGLFLAVAAFAKDFKDGQNVLMPVYLPCSFLGVAPVLPGIELDRVTAWVPVVNITLLIKASLVGRASAELAFFALASSALYAALALLVAARVFANDEVLLGGDGRSAVTGWARSIRSEVGPGAGIFAFAAAMTLVFYVSGALAPLSLPLKIAVVQLGCFLAPALLCAAVFGGWRRSTFGLHAPSSRVLSGAVVLGLSVWSLASLAVWLVPPPADLIQELAATLSLPGVPLPVVWLVLAVLPAVCEEFFFRGLLMGAFARLGPTAALVSTSLLFGLAHGSVYRMLPTTMLGAVLAFVRLRSGSVLPGMVLHGVHNALLVTVIRLRPELAEATGAPAWAYAVAAVGLLSGGALVLRAGGARPPTTA